MDVAEGGGKEEDEDEAALKAAMAMSMGDDAPATVFQAGQLKEAVAKAASDGSNVFMAHGLPADFTGLYELHSIVTHKGRDSDGGHYIGWVRKESGEKTWYKYNDDKVTEHDQAEILMLSGGGDRDIAYLTFYRYKEPKK